MNNIYAEGIETVIQLCQEKQCSKVPSETNCNKCILTLYSENLKFWNQLGTSYIYAYVKYLKSLLRRNS